MRIKVQLRGTTNEIIYDKALNSFETPKFYCILFKKKGRELMQKYPIKTIFRVTEDYHHYK